MTNYVLILIWLAICAFVTTIINLKKPELVCGEWEIRYRWLWALIVFLPVIIWAGTRSGFGDTGVYRQMFHDFPSTFTQLPAFLEGVTKDKGFTVLGTVIKVIIGDRDKLFFCIIAAIQGICLVAIYRKYSSRYFVSIFLFIASADYLSWMFNGMRQFIAASVLFACIGLILRKRYVALILIICIMASIHGSAWILLPMIFIAQGTAWNKKTVGFIAVLVVILASLDQFTSVLDRLLQDTQYNDILTNDVFTQDDGTNILRVVIYAVPAILSFVLRKQIRFENNPVINLCTNMSIISAGLYVVSMFTSGIYVGRLPIYFSLYGYILLPWEIDHMFTKDSRKYIYILMIISYLLFYYYQLHIAWEISLW